MASSPAEFAHKLQRAAANAKTANHRAIEARAKVHQVGIVATARARTKKAGPGWVRYAFVNDDTIKMRLAGGFAVLFQRGSYKKPEGWDEGPKKVTKRRISNAAKKGITLTQAKVLSTPYGPKASVHHPPVAAKPFLREGLDATRMQGHDAYKNIVLNSISEGLK